jgi:hypothetical protein
MFLAAGGWSPMVNCSTSQGAAKGAPIDAQAAGHKAACMDDFEREAA